MLQRKTATMTATTIPVTKEATATAMPQGTKQITLTSMTMTMMMTAMTMTTMTTVASLRESGAAAPGALTEH